MLTAQIMQVPFRPRIVARMNRSDADNKQSRWQTGRTMKHVTKLFPVFSVDNLDDALEYYRDKLGFTVAWTWGDPVSRAGVTLDDVEIQLEDAGLGAPSPSGSSVVYCHMTGVDEYYEACRRRGATISMELGDRPWGMRDFRVRDPSGNRIGFASPV